MILYRATTLKNLRAEVHVGVFSGGSLHIYSGTIPQNGEAVTDQILLCSLTLPDPSGSVDAGAFVMATGIESMAVASGTAGWCRVLDSLGSWLMDLDAGESGSGAAVTIFPTQIYAGGTIRINSFKLIEP